MTYPCISASFNYSMLQREHPISSLYAVTRRLQRCCCLLVYSYIMAFSSRLAVSARLASRAFTSVRPVVPSTASRCFHSTPVTMAQHPVATLNVCFTTRSEKTPSHAHHVVGGTHSSPPSVITDTVRGKEEEELDFRSDCKARGT